MSTENRLFGMETRINGGISQVTVEAVIFILRIVDSASCLSKHSKMCPIEPQIIDLVHAPTSIEREREDGFCAWPSGCRRKSWLKHIG